MKAASKNYFAHFRRLHPEFWHENKELFLDASEA